jgi:hypothetical protein
MNKEDLNQEEINQILKKLTIGTVVKSTYASTKIVIDKDRTIRVGQGPLSESLERIARNILQGKISGKNHTWILEEKEAKKIKDAEKEKMQDRIFILKSEIARLEDIITIL